MSDANLKDLQNALLKFGDARDWGKFHSPKNLAMALSVEVSELLEHFQWLSEEESRQLPPDKRELVSAELADVFMYTLLMAGRMEIDLLDAARSKLALNEKRYPVELVKGSAKKYDQY